jgi:NTP pyrophosphatase (non-canonical NTP hydrolase)
MSNRVRIPCWIQELDIKERQLKLWDMDVKEYQGIIAKTAVFPKEIGLTYCALGLCGEAGEVAEKVKKLYRDAGGVITPEFVAAVKKELGDVLWYITATANELGLSLQEVMEANYEKLIKRRETGTLNGSGDDRENVIDKIAQAGLPTPGF